MSGLGSGEAGEWEVDDGGLDGDERTEDGDSLARNVGCDGIV